MTTRPSSSYLQRLSLSLLLAGSLASGLTACGEVEEEPTLESEDAQGVSDGRDDSGRIAPGTAEGDAVLAFVNQPLADDTAVQDFYVLLDSEMHRIPARAIADYRLGADGTFGTADDATFADLKAIDALPFTGPAAFDQLLELAKANGYFLERLGDCGDYLEKNAEGTFELRTYAQLLQIEDASCNYFSGSLHVEIDDLLVPNARNLEGLSKVEFIEGALTIIGQDSVRGVAGLRKLNSANAIHIKDANFDSLDGLQGLTRLESFTFSEGFLKSVKGLDNLREVNGELSFTGVQDLANLEGLGGLERAGWLALKNCYALQSIDGLVGLTGLGSLSLESNPKIDSLAGLSHLTELQGALTLVNNRSLVDLRDLASLARVDWLISKSGSSQTATSFAGLTSLKTIDNDLSFTDYYGHKSIEGLENLESVGSLTFDGPELTATTGFDNLRQIEGQLKIAALKEMVVEGFPKLESAGGITLENGARVVKLTGFDSLTELGSGSISLTLTSNTISELNAFHALPRLNRLDIDLGRGLTTIGGFDALTEVTGQVSLRGSSLFRCGLGALEIIGGELNITAGGSTFDGFRSLTTVEGNFDVDDSHNLSNLDSFVSIESIGENIYLNADRRISDDALDRFLGRLDHFEGQILYR